ncbi:MAG: mono/diheme cytochrome c family protein [Bermanella sp.]|jgi:mono/diheme cytochrome c family protein
MKKIVWITSAITLVAVLIGCSSLYSNKSNHSQLSDIKQVAAVGDIPQRLELKQAWSNDTRKNFWFTSQGSQIIPYSWFTWLEQADNTELFRSARHMESLRYLPIESSALNPSGLPIGFALNENKKQGEAWVGLTCAACHTNQLNYKGKKILIEGAPTLANFVLFFNKLVDALNTTNQDDAKFVRFAKNVLAGKYNQTNAQALRSQLLQVTIKAAQRRDVNKLPADYPSDFTSFGRLDAFGNIQNAGSAFALNDLNNGNSPTAPVSYPFLWGTHQSDVVQWNASAPNTPVIGPLVRNIGEVVGVFGSLVIREAYWYERIFGIKNRYSSTVDMIGLGKLESWVKTLRSPAWPQEYLPAINAEKAAVGAILYSQECAACHQVISRADEGEDYNAVKTPVLSVGTDTATAWNAEFHMAKTLQLEGTKAEIIIGKEFSATSPAISISVNGVVGIVLKNPLVALQAGLIPGKSRQDKSTETADEKTLEDYISGNINKRKNIYKQKVGDNGSSNKTKIAKQHSDLVGLVYKARPLNGIWATAPYLHNGSVSSLWQLLQKPEQRLDSFWVGDREFDPVNVGFVTQQGLSEFKVLNGKGGIMRGNSNRGHIYGTGLSAKQKWNLVEYMKTL